jgi:flagellar biosynthesis/type III secretory pathway M-ring protein FliF/YscJ
VTVENMRFVDGEEMFGGALKDGQNAPWQQFLPSLAALAIIGALFGILWKLTNYLIKPTGAEVDLGRLLPSGMDELAGEIESERSALRSLPEAEIGGVNLQELEALLGENSRLVKDNPQQAALLIRYWLNEGRA